MSNSNKILFVVFFILLTITGVELFYFFFQSSKNNVPVANNIIIPTPTSCPTCKNNSNKKAKNPAVDPNFIDYLQTLDKTTNTWSLNFLASVEGYVDKLKVEDSKVLLTVADKNHKEIQSFDMAIPSTRFTRKVYNQVGQNFFLVDENKLKELKNGDKIKVFRLYNSSKPPGEKNMVVGEFVVYQTL